MAILQQMKLTPFKVYKSNILPTKPYKLGKTTRQFFQDVKEGRLEEVRKSLEQDTRLIFEFDHVSETALH